MEERVEVTEVHIDRAMHLEVYLEKKGVGVDHQMHCYVEKAGMQKKGKGFQKVQCVERGDDRTDAGAKRQYCAVLREDPPRNRSG